MDSMVPVLCTMIRVVFGLELNGAFEEPGPKDVIRPGYTYVSGRKVNTTAPKPSSNFSICHSSLIFFCYEQQPYLWLFVLTLGTSYAWERRGWVSIGMVIECITYTTTPFAQINTNQHCLGKATNTKKNIKWTCFTCSSFFIFNILMVQTGRFREVGFMVPHFQIMISPDFLFVIQLKRYHSHCH